MQSKAIPLQRILGHNHGYDDCLVAETIANQVRSTGFTADDLVKTFVSGWKNSPERRKNMLDPDVTDIGVAVARRSDSPTYLAVQMFGRSRKRFRSRCAINRTPRLNTRSATAVRTRHFHCHRGYGKSTNGAAPPRLRSAHPTQRWRWKMGRNTLSSDRLTESWT